MTDRELLELAAKAAGIRYTINDEEYYKTHAFFGLWLVYDGEPSEYARQYWNPLTDDGDALRLAVKLGIGTQSYAALGYSHAGSESVSQSAVMKEQHNGDPFAATRRAIVRAAAIGVSK